MKYNRKIVQNNSANYVNVRASFCSTVATVEAMYILGWFTGVAYRRIAIKCEPNKNKYQNANIWLIHP